MGEIAMTQPDYTPERRPIASREKKISQWMADGLARRGASPNAISIIGMFCGIAAGFALAATSLDAWSRMAFIAAAVLMQLRLLANMLDGMVAVQCQKASPVGELYNDVPDRVSDVAAFVGAGYSVGSHAALGYIAAILAVFTAYVRVQGKALGTSQDFGGPMAKPQRVFALTVLALYGGLAPASWQPALTLPTVLGTMGIGLTAIIVGEIWTAWRRLVRIAHRLQESKP
jgi:phosphatidylglycerophosphate synthase